MAPKGAGRYFENVNWIVPIWFNTHKHTCAHMHLDRYVYMIHLFMMKLWQILCMILRACSGKNKQTRAHTCAQTQTYKHTQTHACKHFCTHASRQGTFIWFIYLGSNYVCYAMTIIIYDMCIPLLGECHTRDYLIHWGIVHIACVWRIDAYHPCCFRSPRPAPLPQPRGVCRSLEVRTMSLQLIWCTTGRCLHYTHI